MKQLINIDCINIKKLLALCETAASEKTSKIILSTICFKKVNDNETLICSTDSCVLSKFSVSATFDNSFNEIAIYSSELKSVLKSVLKNNKKILYIHFSINVDDNNNYILNINNDLHFIKVCDNPYPKIENVCFKDGDGVYSFGISINVLEKLLKSMAQINSDYLKIIVNTNSKSLFKVIQHSYDDSIETLVAPVKIDD